MQRPAARSGTATSPIACDVIVRLDHLGAATAFASSPLRVYRSSLCATSAAGRSGSLHLRSLIRAKQPPWLCRSD